MILPKRRERQRSGIQRAPQREWPRHRKFIRSLECSVPNCIWSLSFEGLWNKIECAHVRVGGRAGIAQKPADWHCIPLCSIHHKEQHAVGEPVFEHKYKIDMKRIALALAKQSPDTAMKEAMREAGL